MQKTSLLVVIGFLFLFTPTVLAATTVSTSSAELEDVTENLKRRLQDTLGNPPASAQPPALRSYVGVIRDVIKNTLVVEDKDGKKNVVVEDDATILRTPGNTAIKIEDVRIDDSLIAIGTRLAEDELSGKRLIVSSSPITLANKTSGLGEITKLGKSTLTLNSGGNSLDLTVTGKTVIKSASALSLDPAELALGDTVIYTATVTDGTNTATNLMRIKTTLASPTP